MDRREGRKVDSDSLERGWQYQRECPRGLSQLECLWLTLRSRLNECWCSSKCMECSLCFLCTRISPYRGEPLTGEPDAGDPPVRFGGRGNLRSPYPYIPAQGCALATLARSLILG